MAVAQSLRYYRQQFSPEAAYGRQGNSSSGIMSMYDPEGMDRFVQAVGKRQERFDTAKMAEAAEIARIGETETYDIKELTNRVKSFEDNVNSLVRDKYNGDYSAAANEIAKMIGTERTNPFYHFNKQKVEMGKAYLDAKMKLGANFMSSESPFNVSFKDWQNGKTMEFTPVNRQDIVRDAALEFGSLADTIQNDPTFKSTAGGQYFIATMQNGLRDPKAVMEYMRSPDGEQMIQNIIEKDPELAKFNREDLMGAVTEGAYAAIGKTQRQIVADQSYLDALQQSRIKGGEGGTTNKVTTLGYIEGPKSATTGKPTSVPIHAFSPMYGTTSAEGAEMTSNRKGINEYLSKLIQPGDFEGMTPRDSKLLKNIADKELISFSLIPTTDPNDPYILNLNIFGTPGKTKDNRTPVAVPISVKVVDQADKVNLFTQFSILDPTVFRTYMEQLKEVNPQGYQSMVNAINTAKNQ